jgi:hypothetical protein
MNALENTDHQGGNSDQGELNFQLFSGNDPEELRRLILMLQELKRKKKCEALGEWVNDHEAYPPEEHPEVQRIEERIGTLRDFLQKAQKKEGSLRLNVPASIALSSSS